MLALCLFLKVGCLLLITVWYKLVLCSNNDPLQYVWITNFLSHYGISLCQYYLPTNRNVEFHYDQIPYFSFLFLFNFLSSAKNLLNTQSKEYFCLYFLLKVLLSYLLHANLQIFLVIQMYNICYIIHMYPSHDLPKNLNAVLQLLATQYRVSCH